MRTHGVSPDVIAHARSRRLNVVDATCPFVSVAQRKAAALREAGYAVVILGERDHPEVVGLEGFAGPGAVVVEDAAGLPLERLRGGASASSCRPRRRAPTCRALAAALAPVARELLVFNTICDATEKRQSAACELAEEVDVVVVVGGRNSANTARLAQLCARHRAADPPHRVGRRAARRVAGGRRAASASPPAPRRRTRRSRPPCARCWTSAVAERRDGRLRRRRSWPTRATPPPAAGCAPATASSA